MGGEYAAGEWSGGVEALANNARHFCVEHRRHDEDAAGANLREDACGVEGGERLAAVGEDEDDCRFKAVCEGGEAEAGGCDGAGDVAVGGDDFVCAEDAHAQRGKEGLKRSAKVLSKPQARLHACDEDINRSASGAFIASADALEEEVAHRARRLCVEG